MDLIKKEKELVWVQILYLFLIPILLLYYNIFPVNFRVLLLLLVTLLMFGIAKYEKWDRNDFGIFDNWKKYFTAYFIFTVISIIFLFLISNLYKIEPMKNWFLNTQFLLLFIPISVLQEIVFRGMLMNMQIRAFNNKLFIILLNASIFALMHIIFANAYIILPFTFIAGICFAWMYYDYKNLFLISISHTILNFIAMVLGFFMIR